jgi:hypothetical protein
MALTKVTYSMVAGAAVNVLDYGADPTGVADSTTAIQNALNTAKSVYVPSGTYIVTGLNIPSNTELHGAGYTSHLKLKDGANSRMIYPADEAAIYSNVVISNLRLDGNAANQTTANHHVIALRAYRQTRISNCWIEDAKGDGIIFSENTNSDDPLDFTVENCYIARSGRNGLSITAGQRFTLLNVFSYDAVSGANPGDGFDLETNFGQIIKDGKLIGCQAWGNFGRGFNFQANNANAVERITVSDCHAHDNLGVAGFMLQSARYVLLNNCYSYNNTGDGFRLTLLAAANRFNNCLAQDNDAYGFIEVAGSSVNNNFFLHCFSDGNVINTITLSGAGSVARHVTDANGKDHHQLYVEGTTVPTIGGTVSNPSSVTYTAQFGWFTQIGDRVTINIKIGVSAITGGSGGMAIDLTNIPLCANESNNDSVFQVVTDELDYGAANYVSAFMLVNSRRLVLRGVTTNAALSSINIDPAATIWVTGSYRCAT